MDETTNWTWGTPFGLTLLGAAAGSALVLNATFTDAHLVGVFFVSTLLAAGSATQLYRRGLDHSTLVGGVSGGLGVFAFFATPLTVLAARGNALDVTGAAMLVVVAPLVASAMAAAGTLFLARGVERYRAKHGRIHAPEGPSREL